MTTRRRYFAIDMVDVEEEEEEEDIPLPRLERVLPRRSIAKLLSKDPLPLPLPLPSAAFAPTMPSIKPKRSLATRPLPSESYDAFVSRLINENTPTPPPTIQPKPKRSLPSSPSPPPPPRPRLHPRPPPPPQFTISDDEIAEEKEEKMEPRRERETFWFDRYL